MNLNELISNSSLIYSNEDINFAIEDLARNFNSKFINQKITVLPVMTGALIFAGHLVSKFNFYCELDYIHASRYSNNKPKSKVDWKYQPNIDLIKDKVILVLDDILNPNQFLYYGLRDVDSLELFRLQEYNMKIAYNIEEIESWFNKFDKIHLSFDMDCLDPKYFKSVNTPVNDGIDMNHIKLLFANLKKSNKLLSMDLVEYNPNLGNQNNVIIDLLKYII